MGFDDRLIYLLLGFLIGGLCGYIVRYLQDIKEEVLEIDELVKKNSSPDPPRVRDEGGFMRNTLIADILMGLVVSVVAISAFMTQHVSNNVKDTQRRLDQVVACNQNILFEAIDALNERTTYAGEQSSSNVELQDAQAGMLRILLHEPPYSPEQRSRAAQRYFKAVLRFLNVSEKAQKKVLLNEYPTVEEFQACLDVDEEE